VRIRIGRNEIVSSSAEEESVPSSELLEFVHDSRLLMLLRSVFPPRSVSLSDLACKAEIRADLLTVKVSELSAD